MVADVIVARHNRGAITRISLCFISCSLNETTCKTYKRIDIKLDGGSGPDTPGSIPCGLPLPRSAPPQARLRHKANRLSQWVVTNTGSTVVGHTTLPSRTRQPPKVQDFSGFLTFKNESVAIQGMGSPQMLRGRNCKTGKR